MASQEQTRRRKAVIYIYILIYIGKLVDHEYGSQGGDQNKA